MEQIKQLLYLTSPLVGEVASEPSETAGEGYVA
jgi:hypothetical protein